MGGAIEAEVTGKSRFITPIQQVKWIVWLFPGGGHFEDQGNMVNTKMEFPGNGDGVKSAFCCGNHPILERTLVF